MERPLPAFILSLIGGIFILMGSLFFWIFFSYAMPAGHELPVGPGEAMMWGFMGIWGLGVTIGVFASLVSGIIVIIGAIKVYYNPEQAQLWGTLIIVFSVVSLLGMGGFIIGFLLGLIGGILAVTWKPS